MDVLDVAGAICKSRLDPELLGNDTPKAMLQGLPEMEFRPYLHLIVVFVEMAEYPCRL